MQIQQQNRNQMMFQQNQMGTNPFQNMQSNVMAANPFMQQHRMGMAPQNAFQQQAHAMMSPPTQQQQLFQMSPQQFQTQMNAQFRNNLPQNQPHLTPTERQAYINLQRLMSTPVG